MCGWLKMTRLYLQGVNGNGGDGDGVNGNTNDNGKARSCS
jgi:hypothetical protein